MANTRLEQLLKDASSGGFTALRELLRFLRKEKLRRPDLCMEYAPKLLKFRHSLGDELWTIHEQMAVAAMDLGDLVVADGELKVLQKKFKDSQRVRRLEGMLQEARGDLTAAGKIYEAMVEKNPANQLARKRQVAVLIAQGDKPKAVKALNAYLSEFAADGEAWLQLAKLHIEVLNYEAAAFCYEEIVLIAPSDHLAHCRLAEVYYTMGGVEHLMRARKHFSQSVDLVKQGNARALHGLCQTCASLASNRSASKMFMAQGKEREVNQALHLFAATELRKAYSLGNKEITSLVDGVLSAQAAGLSGHS